MYMCACIHIYTLTHACTKNSNRRQQCGAHQVCKYIYINSYIFTYIFIYFSNRMGSVYIYIYIFVYAYIYKRPMYISKVLYTWKETYRTFRLNLHAHCVAECCRRVYSYKLQCVLQQVSSDTSKQTDESVGPCLHARCVVRSVLA